MAERLQKILAQYGVASRRHAEQLILSGAIRVNGLVATLGQKADPAVDTIEVDGMQIGRSPQSGQVYLLLHKPAGVVTTCSDPWGRPTVLDLLPPKYHRIGLHPVGRLDAQTTGALLLTNNGTLTFHLTHPIHHVPKTYIVQVQGNPSASALARWRQGIPLDGILTRPAQVSVLTPFNARRNTTELKIVLYEGRKRQIRLLAKTLGHPVLQLHRQQIGPIALLDTTGHPLRSGQYRLLTPSEIEALQHIINIKGCTGTQKETSV